MSSAPWQKPFRGMQIDKTHPLSKGLVAAYVFNEATGDTVFDLSGHGDNGTNSGAGWVPEGLDFNGTTDYVDLGNKTINGPNTFLAWIYLRSNTYNDYIRGIVSKGLWGGDGNGDVGLNLGDFPLAHSGTGNFYYNLRTDTNIYAAEDTVDATLNEWIFIAGTYDGSYIRFYKNGLLVGSPVAVSGTFTNNARDIQIGRFPYTGTHTTQTNCIISNASIYDRAISPSEVAQLYREPYAMFQQPISPELLYYEAVGDVSTDLLHGKIIIKDSSIVLVDGLLQIKDIATDLADGKVQVKDTATGHTDGLLRVQDKATGLTDGKVQIQDSVIDLADGKVIVTTVGADTGQADGKIQIKDVTTGIVDGLVKVKDSVTGLADGKVKISNIASNLADGLIQIKDTATGIADGKVRIKDVATGTADGLLKIIEKATSNVDGKLKIKDTITDLADGKISITGAVTAVIRRITIKNKKPSYRLVAEQPKPAFRLKTENK
ncbi:MAG: hypothetical protein KAJ93_01095 [Methanosarcinales archaeon]|nr:hypothetical protein [Methanosarcinales archaeon]